jgi:hypothetical protein
MKNSFTHKGYGRIYVLDAAHVTMVHSIIKQIDEYEYNGYMPKDLIAPFSEYPKVVYTHKFSDMCIDEITARCLKAGYPVWCFDSGRDDYPSDLSIPKEPEPDTL